MKVDPTGVTLFAECEIRSEKCVAKKPAPVTAVWTVVGRTQLNVCRPCLEEQIRKGEWQVEGARVA